MQAALRLICDCLEIQHSLHENRSKKIYRINNFHPATMAEVHFYSDIEMAKRYNIRISIILILLSVYGIFWDTPD